jgi:hypothetical protein
VLLHQPTFTREIRCRRHGDCRQSTGVFTMILWRTDCQGSIDSQIVQLLTVQTDSTVAMYRSIDKPDRATQQQQQEERRAAGERRQPTRQPYSLFVSQERTVTETFSMGEGRSLVVQFKGVQAGVDSMGVNNHPEHLYRDRGSPE